MTSQSLKVKISTNQASRGAIMGHVCWEDIPEDMVKKSCLKTSISNYLDGTEDDELWNDNGNSDDDDLQVEDSLSSAWDADKDVSEEN